MVAEAQIVGTGYERDTLLKESSVSYTAGLHSLQVSGDQVLASLPYDIHTFIKSVAALTLKLH